MVVANFADTNWADDNDAVALDQRIDRYPGSTLDIVFVAGDARQWRSTSRVIVRPNDFPDTVDTSDHRPVEAVLGPEMNVQAPPNLAPEVLELLLRSGLNDWGGVSPVTVDFINPEAPWPELRELERRTAAAGQKLVERLPVYPEHLLGRPDFFDPRVREAALRLADETGWARPPRARARVEAA